MRSLFPVILPHGSNTEDSHHPGGNIRLPLLLRLPPPPQLSPPSALLTRHLFDVHLIRNQQTLLISILKSRGVSLTPQTSLWGELSSPFYRWGKWGLEMISNLVTVTQLWGGPNGIKGQICVTSVSLLNDCLPLSKTLEFQLIHWLCIVQLWWIPKTFWRLTCIILWLFKCIIIFSCA